MADQDICRLSDLPESLLWSNILSRLPLIDAVRSSILCTNWRHLWKKVPHIHFSLDICRLLHSRGEFSGWIMERILIEHDGHLESFGFHVSGSGGFHGRYFDRCIYRAAQKEAKRMILQVIPDLKGTTMHLTPTIFGCTTLLHLQLLGFYFPEIPTSSRNFLLLTTCSLCNLINLTDNVLQKFLELCPALQKLVLVSCRELINLKVQASNLNCLILACCSCLKSLTVDCPQLLQLKTRGIGLEELQINSNSWVELEVRGCYELTKLQLNGCLFVKKIGSLEGDSDVESLRKLSLIGCRHSKLLGIFSGLEELKVSPCMLSIAMERGEKMKMVSDFTFPNLQKAYLDIPSNRTEEDLIGLRFLLRSSPLLKTLTLNLSCCSRKLKKRILGMKRVSAELEINMLHGNHNENEMEYSEESEGVDRFGYGGYGSYKNDVEKDYACFDSETENEFSDISSDPFMDDGLVGDPIMGYDVVGDPFMHWD